MKKIKHYILFPNHTNGTKLAELLKVNKIGYIISPTPRKLSVCCGISIMYHKEDEEKIREIINNNNIDIIGFRSVESKLNNFI